MLLRTLMPGSTLVHVTAAASMTLAAVSAADADPGTAVSDDFDNRQNQQHRNNSRNNNRCQIFTQPQQHSASSFLLKETDNDLDCECNHNRNDRQNDPIHGANGQIGCHTTLTSLSRN